MGWMFELCKPCFHCGHEDGPYGPSTGINSHEGNEKRPDAETVSVSCGECGRRGPFVLRSFENGLKLWEILKFKEDHPFMRGSAGLSPADVEAWRLWDADQDYLASIAQLKAQNELLLASQEGIKSKKGRRL